MGLGLHACSMGTLLPPGMTLQSAASVLCWPDNSRARRPSSALPSVTCRQGCQFACSQPKGQNLDLAVQELMRKVPFPGILADQGRHDLARLVMHQLLQVRE